MCSKPGGFFSLPLALFELRVFLVDHIEFAFAADDLTISAAFLDGGSYFHKIFISKIDT